MKQPTIWATILGNAHFFLKLSNYFTFPDMTNEQMDELRAEIGRASPMTCEEERLLLKAVKEKGADSDEMKAVLFDGLSVHLAVILEK